MRKMADSVTAADLPDGCDLYMGYADGAYVNVDTIRQRFAGKTVVEAVTNPGNSGGQVGDGPPDNGTWPEWVAWVQRRRGAGAEPTMYTDRSQKPVGQAAFAAAGVPEPLWGIADWTGTEPASLDAGEVFVQYAGPHQSGGHFDLSAVADHWPGVDAPNGPAPDPAPPPPAPAPTHHWRAAGSLPELAAGCRGDAVAVLQRLVNAADHAGLAVDGMFGPLTGAAVARYQAGARLAVDQIVGPETWGKLASPQG